MRPLRRSVGAWQSYAKHTRVCRSWQPSPDRPASDPLPKRPPGPRRHRTNATPARPPRAPSTRSLTRSSTTGSGWMSHECGEGGHRRIRPNRRQRLTVRTGAGAERVAERLVRTRTSRGEAHSGRTGAAFTIASTRWLTWCRTRTRSNRPCARSRSATSARSARGGVHGREAPNEGLLVAADELCPRMELPHDPGVKPRVERAGGFVRRRPEDLSAVHVGRHA